MGKYSPLSEPIRLEFVEFVRLRIEKKILVTRLFSCKLGFKSDIILGKHRCNNKTGTSLKQTLARFTRCSLLRYVSRGEMRIDCVEWTTHWLKIYGCEYSYTQLQLGKDFEV